MQRWLPWCLAIAFIQVSGVFRLALATEPDAAGIEFFESRIRPLLNEHCFECHSARADAIQGELLLDSREGVLKGGENGPAIVPFEPEKSRILAAVGRTDEDLQMPPDGPLTDQAIADLKTWIERGAPWPKEDSPANGVVGNQDYVISPEARSHWSFQPVTKPPIPSPGHAIDYFIVKALSDKRLSLSPPAEETVLLRRLYFDLIGLPPTPAEMDEYMADDSPDRYQRWVDRLLASPHYGERWARHWLDVVRFTESEGFEYDRMRNNAWHYRDYVIESFNDDKPYDDFIREQIAGDVITPQTSESIVAASLLVCGPYDSAGNGQANSRQKAITREEEMEDMLSVVGQTFMGLTIHCARCHHHKFDPIPQADYYRMKAIFDGVKHGERSIASDAETKASEELKTQVNQELIEIRRTIAAIHAAGRKIAQAKRPPSPYPLDPIPKPIWAFYGPISEAPLGELLGGAQFQSEELVLEKAGAFFQSEPLACDVGEKTLEAWVRLDNLQQAGGGVITLETIDGQHFDSIVFGERQPAKWMAGSDGFARTRDLDADQETDDNTTFIHVAVVYRLDQSIAVYRNGEAYGSPYTPESPLQTFSAGQSRVLIGMRHTGAQNGGLTGAIRAAAVYPKALSASDVALLFKSSSYALSEEEILACLTSDERAARDEALGRQKQLQAKLAALQVTPRVSYAGVRVQPMPTQLLLRGDIGSPQEVVSPAALLAIESPPSDLGLSADAPEAERRLRFADWLVDPRNPLPARVMVNRIWQYHFGQGIVATPSDFGMNGIRPTHPELLDWLAAEFVESGWSLKHLHRVIVSSDVYKQSSEFNSEAAAMDADNQWLWRFPPRRLEAETIRDNMLYISGQMNLEMGGPSFRPFTTTEFGATFYHLFDKESPEFNRRTIYRMNVNSGKDPLLDVFDCPDPSIKVPRRGVTITPLQALALMNGSFVQRQAHHLAKRAEASSLDLQGAIQVAYRWALGRHATEAELQKATEFANRRGLVSICWALLNSTEFLYVR
jgi:Protein of unknown function (DUF1553)/Protein of unknown function (DUF1549)/Planctomycete cytochrome C/Concanavalin A-like lectin/glucanases superfamily